MAKLWGARFEKGTDKLADQFSYSIGYDYRLAIYDVIGSIAHARMLGKCKIISQKDSAKLIAGLKKIGQQIERGTFKFDAKAEDIHTNIQTELKKIVGSAADKLHTARSRNDLVVLDMKLFCLYEISKIDELLENLQAAIVGLADKNKNAIIPAYTHLQSAQVVLFAHHLLAYVEMLERDKARLEDAFIRTDVNPLGSCALSGSSLPTDRSFVSKELGFASTSANSIDSVSDRDFIIEFLSDLAILAMHTSRMAEDMIIWSTKEFHFVDIDWSLCTGSSIMPHKKNPDICELIRGETATVYSNLNKVLVLMKGLPLTYNRDMQLDKIALFESVDKIKEIIMLLEKLFTSLKLNKTAIEKRIYDESFFTVDIMEYLIKKGVSYREAHDIVGTMVKQCLDKGKQLKDLSLSEFKKFSKAFEGDIKTLLNPNVSVRIKQSFGSTNPVFVDKQIKFWKNKLK